VPSSRPETDRALVRRCLRGDEPAWETLVRRYRRLIYSIPVAYRIPAGEADEIFQRVAVKLFEGLEKLRSAEALPAWLSVTTRRECQAFLRSSRRFSPIEETSDPELAEDPPDVTRAIDQVRLEHTLGLALERLDGTCRDLLAAMYIEDPTPSYQEIAVRLGRPVGSLGPTRSRCLGKLRKIYRQLGGDSP
jgi:RNA polymerase sigma factor (sigma-70 family)